MKFEHKVNDHKRKVGIDLEVLVPTVWELRAKKGQNKHFLGFRTITLV